VASISAGGYWEINDGANISGNHSYPGNGTISYMCGTTVMNGGIIEDTEMLAAEEVELFAAEAAVVTVDNLYVLLYNDLLVTGETIAALEEKKAELVAVLEAYETEDTEDDIYIANSVDANDLEAAIASIDEALETEGLLEDEANEVLASVADALSGAVTVATAEAFPGRFAGFEEVIESLMEDPESEYSEDKLQDILDLIEEAKDTVNEDGVTSAKLDAAFNSVAKAISDLGVYTENGIPTYTQAFTGGYSLSQFEAEWYHTGANHQSVPVTTANGIPINLWGAYPDQSGCFRYQMHFRKSYPVYSVQATLTREAPGKMMFGVRQTLGSDCYEQDYSVTPTMLGYQGVSIQEVGAADNFATIYVVVRDGQYKTGGIEDSRVYTKIDLTTLPGVLSEDKKTFTPLIKDFGEMIEIYAVNNEGENVPLAKVVFDAIITKVTARGTTYDGYSSGTIYNLVTDEVVPFTGMAVQIPDKSYITFSSRSGRYCVKDFQINTNILPAEETLVFDGTTDPTSVALEIAEDVIDVDGETTFTVNAEFESLKVAGKNEYKPGSIDVKAAPAVTVTTTLGDSVVSVDATNGTITAVARGTEIITATYTLADGSTVTDKKLITVTGEEYTAPTEENAFEGRIVAARFANADVFKSVEVGTEIVPVIEYEYPNGETGILPADCYVKYFSEDDDIMAYDEAKGAYVAKAEGYTKLFAEVYMTLSTEPVETSKANVEVAAEGEATLGAGATVAAMDLLDAAHDDSLTLEEKKAVIDAAIANEIAISYEDDLDAELLMAAIVAVAEENEDDELSDLEVIAQANTNAKAVRKVYDVINNEETTSDDLADLLFGENGIYRELNISEKNMRKYDALTNTKASRLMTRLFTQLAKKGTDLTAQGIVESFETILKSVSEGGGSGKGGVTITTDKNNGPVGFVPATPAAKPAEPVKEVITEEQINVAVAKFSDVEEAAWAKHAIGVLTHKGIIDGYEDGTIRPNGMITRDEFVKLLVVAFELDVKADAYNYFWADVKADGWQVPYIAAAHEANILVGTDGGAFGSNVRITREDMAAMIYKAVLMKKATLPSDKIVAFTDAENIEGYAVEAVNKLAAAGVISGMGDGTFAPAAGATRAQAFQMIALVLEAI
ncbi:MAG: S-layer homology domain-containing protein, partial [Clostridia bacterium]|nr:S-layer homology domain-containing protein [Clostridia bacterium]